MDRCLLVFEGPDGCGKTTISRLVRDELNAAGAGWVGVPDPSEGPVGQLIRGFLRGGGSQPLAALGYLFMADRMDQLDAWAQPLVVADRYMLSTWVYQHGHMPPKVLEACLADPRLRVPDIQVYLDVDLDQCLERCAKRKGKAVEVFEHRERMVLQHLRYQKAWEQRDSLPPAVAGTRQLHVKVRAGSTPTDVVKQAFLGLDELADTKRRFAEV